MFQLSFFIRKMKKKFKLDRKARRAIFSIFSFFLYYQFLSHIHLYHILVRVNLKGENAYFLSVVRYIRIENLIHFFFLHFYPLQIYRLGYKIDLLDVRAATYIRKKTTRKTMEWSTKKSGRKSIYAIPF